MDVRGTAARRLQLWRLLIGSFRFKLRKVHLDVNVAKTQLSFVKEAQKVTEVFAISLQRRFQTTRTSNIQKEINNKQINKSTRLMINNNTRKTNAAQREMSHVQAFDVFCLRSEDEEDERTDKRSQTILRSTSESQPIRRDVRQFESVDNWSPERRAVYSRSIGIDFTSELRVFVRETDTMRTCPTHGQLLLSHTLFLSEDVFKIRAQFDSSEKKFRHKT